MKRSFWVRSLSFMGCLLLLLTILPVGGALPVSAEPGAGITVTYRPQIGARDPVKGYVSLGSAPPANYDEYMVIAFIHTIGYGDFIKPTYQEFRTNIRTDGSFTVNITTGSGDEAYDDFSVFLVRRADYTSYTNGNAPSLAFVQSNNLASLRTKKSDVIPAPSASPVPGFIAAGTNVSLTIPAGGGKTVYYTTDGSDPKSAPGRLEYLSSKTFLMTEETLLIKAVTFDSIKQQYSQTETFTYLLKRPNPEKKPFFGLCLSLNLGGEGFGYMIPEQTVKERTQRVAPLTRWVRTFATDFGLQHVNRYAKEVGMQTMIGLYITNDSARNTSQIENLAGMLGEGEPMDLIAVGNELSLYRDGSNQPVSTAVWLDCLSRVRQAVRAVGRVIPIGTVDIYGAATDPEVMEQLDFSGGNFYPGVWDSTPLSGAIDKLKTDYQTFAERGKMTLLTETGRPYKGNPYLAEGVLKDSPKAVDAVDYLNRYLHWSETASVPGFYFQSYLQPAKAAESGVDMEQYFGLMGADGTVLPIYDRLLRDVKNEAAYTASFYEGKALVSNHRTQSSTVTVSFAYYREGILVKKNDVPVNLGALQTIEAEDPNPVPDVDSVAVLDPAEQSVTGVQLDHSMLTMVAEESDTLTATVSPANATNPALRWSSDNSAVATVYQNGRVVAKTAGVAVITVTSEDGGYTDSCIVTVSAVQGVTGVQLKLQKKTLNAGTEFTLRFFVMPENAADKRVTWQSGDKKIATVSGDGVVRGLKEGIVTITVKTAEGGFTARCTVTVKRVVSSVKITNNPSNVLVGHNFTLKATIAHVGAVNPKVVWNSQSPAIAAVSAAGTVKALSPGKAVITAELDGRKAVCTLTVHSYVTLKVGSPAAIQNGVKTTVDQMGSKPFTIEGRTMLPIRFVAEKMGGKVSYTADSQPIVVRYGGIRVEFRLGSRTIQVTEGKTTRTLTIDVPAQKRGGRTYIPLRAVSAALGFDVYYEGGTEYVVVNNPKMTAAVKKERLAEAKAILR